MGRLFVLCHSNNTAVVSQVNLLHSQDLVASNILCCLAYFQAHFDFWLRAVHIPGVRNIGADDLSRNRAATFLGRFSQASPSPTQVNQELLRLLCQEPADWTSVSWRERFASFWRQAWQSLPSESTKRVYNAGWKRYIAFAGSIVIPAVPVTTESVTLFAAFLGAEGLAISTIESYLAALRHVHLLANPSCPAPSWHSPHMKVLLRGIRQIQAQQSSARVRLPITPSLMRIIKAQLARSSSSYISLLIWAACCTGVLWVPPVRRIPGARWYSVRCLHPFIAGRFHIQSVILSMADHSHH